MNRVNTWTFQNDIYVQATGTVVGPLESQGPIGDAFDESLDDLHDNKKSWEEAERTMMEKAIAHCLRKDETSMKEVNVFLTGDLINQNVIGSYTARDLNVPTLGIFGACSTSVEGISIGAALVDGGFVSNALTAVSSHNATAERQYRYPTEYGSQKPSSATFTVTGSGALFLSRQKSDLRIESSTIGRVVDFDRSDPWDLGSAMAPAAADTIKTHLEDKGRSPEYYDLIVTGDLSSVGTPLVRELLKEDGIDITENHRDCGLWIYSKDQPVFSGGSGCACSAVVTYGHIFEQMMSGVYERVLLVATGALMNPLMIQQKESIPSVAHAVAFERVKHE
ncbi:stage V sporulation protein AD [Salimicrobium halophilum]|uniref:Stage V sporulation protein AD n=1 Tax=Salimicrobium halophilum TaxID=86666 RepID=A0A1G8PXW3_9BACI|nr:stage V sporulation protein AD [Salimicrobium halophilum]SDI97208.1 stage V sporulation protein AD [Salimicrobium halophilum]